MPGQHFVATLHAALAGVVLQETSLRLVSLSLSRPVICKPRLDCELAKRKTRTPTSQTSCVRQNKADKAFGVPESLHRKYPSRNYASEMCSFSRICCKANETRDCSAAIVR